MLDPARVVADDCAPPVAIERVVIDDSSKFTPTSSSASGGDPTTHRSSLPSYSSQTPILSRSLRPGRARLIQIHYTAPTFRAPERVRFRYRLEGFDREWVDAGFERMAL